MDFFKKYIVRPFRSQYQLQDLGKCPHYCQKRMDQSVINQRGFRLEYSYYQNKIQSDICVIYAHCNSGSRLEGICYLRLFMEKHWNVLLFDFAGSGLSEGANISLGFFQSLDLKIIVQQALKKSNKKILLWGRSMGASTILRYLEENPIHEQYIYGCVLDSPFSDLEKLVSEIVSRMTCLPQLLFSPLLSILKTTIKEQQQFDIQELEFASKINFIKCSLIFLVSKADNLVDCRHTETLFQQFRGKKYIEYIAEEHNEARSIMTKSIVIKLLQKQLMLKENMLNVKHVKSKIYMKQTIKKQVPQRRFRKSQCILKHSNTNVSFTYTSRSNINIQQYSDTSIMTKKKYLLQGNQSNMKFYTNPSLSFI